MAHFGRRLRRNPLPLLRTMPAKAVMALRGGIGRKGARTQVVWWYPKWQGIRFFRWGGAANCLFRWSLNIGFVEFRRWRSTDERKAMFAAYIEQCEREDA